MDLLYARPRGFNARAGCDIYVRGAHWRLDLSGPARPLQPENLKHGS
jgi:hypothetical protein